MTGPMNLLELAVTWIWAIPWTTGIFGFDKAHTIVPPTPPSLLLKVRRPQRYYEDFDVILIISFVRR